MCVCMYICIFIDIQGLGFTRLAETLNPNSLSGSILQQDSSQFASALLLSSRAGGWDVSTPPDANPDEPLSSGLM